METQRCGHCKVDKPLTGFAPSYRGRPGTWCRECMKARYTPHPRVRPSVPDGCGYCPKCQETKPADGFYRVGGRPDGKLITPCRECYRLRHIETYQPVRGDTGEPRPCLNCGRKFKPKTRINTKYCSRECGEEYRVSSGRVRDAYLRRKYGISAEDYDHLLIEQGGGCALCGVAPESLTKGRYRTYLHVDHDHETGKVRGLLCPDCNLNLGRVTAKWMEAALAYMAR